MTAAEGARLEVKREAKRSWRDGKGIRGEAWAAVSAVGVGAGSYCTVLQEQGHCVLRQTAGASRATARLCTDERSRTVPAPGARECV
jgi:hypothetical protein